MRNYLLFAGLLLCLTSLSTYAQTPWALKPYAITLPRVTTSQQSSTATVPQQAGNMVYNTEQQAVAVHNGTGWGYLSAGASDFKNSTKFYTNPQLYEQIWTVPAGVNQIMIEAWGGGAGGNIYTNLGNGTITCKGGGPGSYISYIVKVTPATSLSVRVGSGGRGAAGNGVSPVSNARGDDVYVFVDPINFLIANGGATNGFPGPVGVTAGITPYLLKEVIGQHGQDLVMAYEPRGTDYVLNLKLGNGGLAYGTMPGGYGGQLTTLNGGAVLYQVAATQGSFPGGGGGCGYNYGGKGADGLVIIRW